MTSMSALQISPLDAYNHIVDHYAKIDLKMEEYSKVFIELMDLTNLLAVYTKKQEQCQALAADAGNSMIMADMV